MTSAFCTPIVAPAARVRIATAPSTVMVFSSSRPPLMLKPPLVSDEKPGVVEVAADDAGLERGHADGVAAGERQQLDVLGFDRLANGDLRLQRRGLGRDRDFFGERAGFEREIERHRARRVELHVGAADLLEAAQLDQKLIAAGVQVRKCVEAAAVGDGRVGLLRLGARHRDGRARDDAALRVLDCARDRSSIELCESRRRYA